MNNGQPNTVSTNILVVDDNPANLRLLVGILAEQGYKVRPATNGRMALAAAQTEPPDLILLDIMMPEMNGYAVCERLKADARTCDIPVIFVSAMSEVLNKVKAFSIGGVDYIAKPFQAEEVLARVKTHLILRQIQKELEQKNVQLQQEISQRQQAKEALQQRSHELTLINRASQAFSSTLDLDEVLQSVLGAVHRLLDTVTVSFWLRVPETGELVCRQATGPNRDKIIGWRLAPGQGLTGQAAELDQSLIVADTRTDKRHFKKVDQKTGVEVRSMLNIPLRVKGEVIGVLTLVDTKVGRFTTDDLRLLEPIAVAAASAIENSRLFEAEQKAKEVLAQTLQQLKATQDQLIVHEKMASLGQLTSGIAHEIKNPLNFVNNFAAMSLELIEELQAMFEGQKTRLADEARAEIADHLNNLALNATKIKEEGKRADKIVRSMLLHSRGGSGERQKIDLNTLLDEAINLTYHSLRAKKRDFHINIETDYDSTLEPLVVMPQDLSRVFVNMISNACYATRKKQKEIADDYVPTLSVCTKNLVERVEIHIRDNGIGLSPEVRDKIFNPFFTTKPPGEGTGLGLSIGYDIITQGHQGTIEVDSEVGQFTEFVVSLPKQEVGSKG